MSSIEKAKAQKAEAQRISLGLKCMAKKKLAGLYSGRVGTRLLDAVELAEVAFGTPFVLHVSADSGKLKLSSPQLS